MVDLWVFGESRVCTTCSTSGWGLPLSDIARGCKEAEMPYWLDESGGTSGSQSCYTAWGLLDLQMSPRKMARLCPAFPGSWFSKSERNLVVAVQWRRQWQRTPILFCAKRYEMNCKGLLWWLAKVEFRRRICSWRHRRSNRRRQVDFRTLCLCVCKAT